MKKKLYYKYLVTSFKVYIKTEYMYLDIAKNVEAIFDTSNYKCDRPLPNGEK